MPRSLTSSEGSAAADVVSCLDLTTIDKGTLMAVYVEDWGANYGAAYLVTQDDAGLASAELVEDGPDLIAHDGVPPISGDGVIAFVDGVRRGEASLWQEDSAGRSGRGVAGGHACGAVIADSASAA